MLHPSLDACEGRGEIVRVTMQLSEAFAGVVPLENDERPLNQKIMQSFVTLRYS